MTMYVNSGSRSVNPQRYHTLPTAILSQAEQQDRGLKQSELKELTDFFRSGAKLVKIAATLTQNAEAIISAAANRIFFGGSPMNYLEPPENRENLPGYTTPPRQLSQRPQERLQVQSASNFGNPLQGIAVVLTALSGDRDPVPEGFRLINISRYGPTRMKRSMRDLSWFLRYVTYAIVAGDSSILSVNVEGLRGIIPEDVTEATIVAIREMRWRSLGYFKDDPEATTVIKQHFDALIAAYLVEKPSIRVRLGVSNDQQGLQLPESYGMAETSRPKFVMKPHLAATEQQAVIKAAYRQILERDITREYGIALGDLESKLKGGEISTKEFVRRLGKSRVYRREFYEPFVISRVIELAVRHFLGRGLSSIEEFQNDFDVISRGGLPALIDTLVDSQEYSDYFGEETVPYLRGLGQEAQECRNWSPQLDLFKFSAPAHKVPQFITLFGEYQKPLPNQHVYGAGNDPLDIQFGAIFPYKDRNFDEQPAPLLRDSRRILISCQPGNGNGNGANHAVDWGKVPGFRGDRVLKLEPSVHPRSRQGEYLEKGVNVSLLKNSPTAVIQGAYRQVFGRDVLADQHLTTAESQLQAGEITVREFIRQLAKSRLFRRLYWEPLYITKAIEYIHRRLLGRPTYGRQEMSQYYDICARQGFYKLVDAIMDSAEYLETFGDDTVPYERYVTPRGFALRSRSYSGSSRDPHEGVGSLAQGPRVAENSWMKTALHRVNVDNQSHWLKSQQLEQGVPLVGEGNGNRRETQPVELAPDSQTVESVSLTF